MINEIFEIQIQIQISKLYTQNANNILAALQNFVPFFHFVRSDSEVLINETKVFSGCRSGMRESIYSAWLMHELVKRSTIMSTPGGQNWKKKQWCPPCCSVEACRPINLAIFQLLSLIATKFMDYRVTIHHYTHFAVHNLGQNYVSKPKIGKIHGQLWPKS